MQDTWGFAIDVRIEVTDQDTPDGREAILPRLLAFNRENGPPTEYRFLGLLLKDSHDLTTGGLWGSSVYDWLFVELLFVPEPLRRSGLGRSLMLQAEIIARERGCTGVWLDTFAFQALPFYQKLGYTVFGELKDHPRGMSQFWLQKRL